MRSFLVGLLAISACFVLSYLASDIVIPVIWAVLGIAYMGILLVGLAQICSMVGGLLTEK
jgi:uncharacterized integral membrane protein